MSTLLFILLLSLPVSAPTQRALYIEQAEPIRPYEVIWNATCKVESNFNPHAIGDKNLKDWSYGISQIRQSRLDDFHRRTGIRYTTTEMLDPEKAKIVFMHYACDYHPSDNERISRCWNGGTKGMQKKATVKYYLKILKSI